MKAITKRGYWDEQMKNLPDIIRFSNGYAKNRPTFDIEVLDWALARSTHPEWGGDINNMQFIFQIKEYHPKIKPTRLLQIQKQLPILPINRIFITP